MNYLQFDKTQLINLNYSLNKEIVRTNRAGSYSLTTLVACNTRKYHGLLTCPIPHFHNEAHLLLSALDETIVVNKQVFNLGVHLYGNDIVSPQGHKYIRDLYMDETLGAVYRIGDVVLRKESIMADGEEQTLIRYTLEESSQPITMQFRPFLAFRNIHALSRANLYVNTKAQESSKGMSFRMYDGYPDLHIQLSVRNEYIHAPDWYYDIEYPIEKSRGYDFREDLLVPGYFETRLKQGDSIVLSASTLEQRTETLKRKFNTLRKKRVRRDNFKDCLVNAAHQFIVHHNNKTQLIAGYPWFEPRSRDTFIALPGLSNAFDTSSECTKILDSMIELEKKGLFPASLTQASKYFDADTALWCCYSIQNLFQNIPGKEVWKRYGKTIQSILNQYKKGHIGYIRMLDNGLIYASQENAALTWMNSSSQNAPITPRQGCTVEINALWYNAIQYGLELAGEAKDTDFINEWENLPTQIENSFIETFWNQDKAYLADYVNGEETCWDIRPNMLIAVALPYTPVDKSIISSVSSIARQSLLTPRGLRSLSPENASYKGIYEGSAENRDLAYHQGCVWPWLLPFYVKACQKILGTQTRRIIEEIVRDMEEVVFEHGIGTIAEIYDGDPPHQARGCISQAWSVAALLEIIQLHDEME